MEFSQRRDANVSKAFEHLATYRKMIPEARSEQLLKVFEEVHWCLAQLALARELGICNDPQIEQHCRLMAYAVEQELLRRLRASS